MSIARDLLGKIVVTRFGGFKTAGRIVETEAYAGITDKASHAYGGRRTLKNEHMYQGPGTAYIYVCYGMHQMLNVVTNAEGIPDAVLIRALQPLEGLDHMGERTGKDPGDPSICRGPGNVGKALGIHRINSGLPLKGNEIYLAEDGFNVRPGEIGVGKRIGVESAGADALLPYRFFVRGNKFVSGRKS